MNSWSIARVLRSAVSWMRNALRNWSSSWVEFTASVRMQSWLSSRVRLEARVRINRILGWMLAWITLWLGWVQSVLQSYWLVSQ